jgi:hypothetical protein
MANAKAQEMTVKEAWDAGHRRVIVQDQEWWIQPLARFYVAPWELIDGDVPAFKPSSNKAVRRLQEKTGVINVCQDHRAKRRLQVEDSFKVFTIVNRGK